jgi:hypothetical protein
MAPERPPLAAEAFGGLLQEQLGGHTTVQAVLSPIMWLGVAGFVASALVHVFALAGVPSPFGSATWVLHIGIFVVVANDSHCSAPRKEFQTGGILESRVSRLPPVGQIRRVCIGWLCGPQFHIVCRADWSLCEERGSGSRELSGVLWSLDGVLLRRCSHSVLGHPTWRSQSTAVPAWT